MEKSLKVELHTMNGNDRHIGEAGMDSEKQKLAEDERGGQLAVSVIPKKPKLPDGGYGWVVVFGSFLCNFLFGAICFPFGKVMAEFMVYFDCSVMVGSMVGSLLFGLTLLFGKYRISCLSVSSLLTDLRLLQAAVFFQTFSVLVEGYGEKPGEELIELSEASFSVYH